MQQIDGNSLNFQNLRFSQARALAIEVDIPPHRRHRSNLFELPQNLRVSYVANMQNPLHAIERRRYLWRQQPMRVAYPPNFHPVTAPFRVSSEGPAGPAARRPES